MYNRYIPQPDGSYRRDRVADPQPQRRHQPPKQECEETCEPETACPLPKQEQECAHEMPRKQAPCRRNTGAGDFLRQLLPKNLDTGDLLVIILLLLMAGDCAEDQNTALLTLALYLFL